MDTRFEIKYVLHERQAQSLLREIAPFMKRDPHSLFGSYEVRSLYFDTARLSFAEEVVDGQQDRLKVRYREYGFGAPFGFLEIKRKIRNKIKKDRIRCSWDTVEDVMSVHPKETLPPAFDLFVYEFRKHRLSPSASVTYLREAYAGVFGGDFRLTIDRNIRCGPRESFFRPTSREDLRVLPVGLVVLELKFGTCLPKWVKNAVGALEIQPTAYSKYAKGIKRINGMPLFTGGLNHG